jgi:hypothetical protein
MVAGAWNVDCRGPDCCPNHRMARAAYGVVAVSTRNFNCPDRCRSHAEVARRRHVSAMLYLVVALVWYPAGAATIVHDKDRLVLTGPIRWGDSVVFFAAVNSDCNIRTVVLDSYGGLVDEAIEIGRIIRERHLDTAVPPSSSCVSACVLVWAAGQRRTVDGQLATHCPAFQDTFQCVPPTRQLM